MKYSKPILYTLFIFVFLEQLSNCLYSTEEKELIEVSDEEFPHWRYWQKADGLNEDWVNLINNDYEGNLWIAQPNRTLRFDGFSFSHIPFLDGYNVIERNRGGQIWAFDKKGVKILVDTEWIEHEVPSTVPFYQQSPYIVSFQKDQFYFITSAELLHYDASTRKTRTLRFSKDTSIGDYRWFATDFNKTLWIGANHGMAEIPLKDFAVDESVEWNYILYPPVNEGEKFKHIFVYPNNEVSVTVTTNDTKYGKLFYYHQGNWDTLYEGFFNMGWLGPDGGFWLTQRDTNNNSYSLFYYNGGKRYKIKSNKFNKAVFRVLSYSRDFFWFNNGNGLVHFSAPPWMDDYTLPPQNENFFSGTIDQDDNTWLVTPSTLLKKTEMKWEQYSIPFTLKLGLLSNNSLYYLSNQFICLKGLKSLALFDPTTEEFKSIEIPNTLNIIGPNHKWSDDSLMLGTVSLDQVPSLKIVNKETLITYKDFSNEDFKGQLSNGFLHSDGTYWFIKDFKLYWLTNSVLSTPPEDSELSQLELSKMIQRKNGRVVIVTKDLKIYEYDGNNLQLIRNNDITHIERIIESVHGDLWVCANNGIHIYRNNLWLKNDINDGLYDAVTRFVIFPPDGHALAGSEMGIRVYTNERDTAPPETRIPSELNANEFLYNNDIRFSLEGIDRWNYTKPEHLSFSYNVNNEGWSKFQESNILVIGKLLAGNYTMQVRAMDRNWNIDPTPASVSFTVKPPWFKEPVFLLLLIVGSILILLFGYYAVRNHYKLLNSLHQTQHTVKLLERTKSRLTESKTKAEEATKAKDGFLARMSHEIRTPLNGIIGNLELINRSKMDKKDREFFQTAKISANALMDIIGDVLDFAKIEADKLALENKPISLPALFEETISVMTTRAEEKGILLGSNLAKDVPQTVLVDPIRLRQVMMNLIGNAIKFTDYGSVAVMLKHYSITNDKATIHFEVKDTGVGFDMEHKDDLFREFEQDDTSNKTAEGTGLGLSICKRIIEMMGGSIECDSQKGLGSRFWFEVQVQVVEKALAHSSFKNPTEQIDNFHFDIAHPILVIDDRTTNRMLAVNQLSKLGIESDTAEGGIEALDKVNEKQYSMLLVDCSMPEMDGFEFTRKYRSLVNDTHPHTPVIAMTAHVVSDIRDRCQTSGMDDYLSKPVKIENLIEMIQKWILPNQEIPIDSQSSMNTIETEPYDFSLDKISKFTSIDDPNELMQFLQVVNQELITEYENMLQAVNSKDMKAFLAKAHSLKGLAGPISLTPITDTMKQFQSQSMHISWTEIEDKLPEIHKWISIFQNSIQSCNNTVPKD